MSSQQFIETLKQIGYPRASSLNAKSLDWMFEDEAVLPFLTWFCSTVGHLNVLTTEEKASYEELEKSGGGSLEGPQLEEALACVSSTLDEDVSVESLREEVERLKEDAERHGKRKHRLVQTRNKLSLHHTGLTHRLSKFTGVEMATKQKYKHALEDCQRANSEMTDSLERVVRSTKDLLSLYQDSYPSEHSAVADRYTSVFLSQHDLDAYHQMEEKYTRELTNYTKKQFFEGIADMAGGETSRYELLEVSDPMSLLVRGHSQHEFQLDCQELARLQSVFPKSESERINALVEEKCATHVLHESEAILRSVQNGHFPTEIQDLNSHIEAANVSLVPVRRELRQLTNTEIPELIRELSTYLGTTVLTGDYRLKLARQDYFTTNQDKVIKYLIDQRARNEFLSMAYEIEAQNDRDVHRLLTAIQRTLGARLAGIEERLKIMSDPLLTKARHERGTVDTRDVASTCLHHVLVPVDERSLEKQLFLSYSQMVSAADALRRHHAAAKGEAAATADKFDDRLRQLEREVHRCEDVLYAESSTLGGQPMLTPCAVQDAMTELDDMLQKLEAVILDTITDINTKKKSLKKDVLQTKERELFTLFHLHPDRLLSTVANLEQRLQAQSVS